MNAEILDGFARRRYAVKHCLTNSILCMQVKHGHEVGFESNAVLTLFLPLAAEYDAIGVHPA